jgi:putative sigma-54 modulation protein
MNITVTARHFDMSDALRERVERRFARLERFYQRVSRVEVTLTDEARQKRAEARAAIDGDVDVHAEATAHDFRTAVDSVYDKLARQLKRRHDLRRAHQAPRLNEEIAPKGIEGIEPEEVVEGG